MAEREIESSQKLADLVGAAEVMPMRAGTTAIGGVILMKTMSAEGEMAWSLRHFGDLSQVELVGALSVTLDRERQEYADGWEEDDEDA